MTRVVLVSLLFVVGACGIDGDNLGGGDHVFVEEPQPPVMRGRSTVDGQEISAHDGAPTAQPTKDAATVGDAAMSVDALPPCEEGPVVFEATYWCEEWDSSSPNALWRDDCRDGQVMNGYYPGLPCPFDVAVAHGSGWMACDGCVDNKIIVNGGSSTSAVWRGDGEGQYCCDGKAVRYGK